MKILLIHIKKVVFLFSGIFAFFITIPPKPKSSSDKVVKIRIIGLAIISKEGWILLLQWVLSLSWNLLQKEKLSAVSASNELVFVFVKWNFENRWRDRRRICQFNRNLTARLDLTPLWSSFVSEQGWQRYCKIVMHNRKLYYTVIRIEWIVKHYWTFRIQP